MRPNRIQVRRPRTSRWLRTALPVVAAALLVTGFLALLLLVPHPTAAVASSSGTGGAGTPPPNGQGGKQPWCDAPGLPACPTPDPGWVPITGETPRAAADAISRSSMFGALQGQVGHLSLDTPALVHLLLSRGGSDYWTSDHWVVSARNDAGVQIGLFDYVYDRAHQRIRFANYGYISANDPRYGHAFPYSTAASAIQRLQVERKVSPRASSAPLLVYFPPDPRVLGPAGNQAPIPWSGGGEYPTDPMWMVPGADGRTYFVGKDSHVHNQSELPIAQ